MGLKKRRKSFLSILFAVSLLLLLAACGAANEQEPTEQPGTQTESEEQGGGTTDEGQGETAAYDAEAAESLYKASCAGCHGANLQGGLGPELATVGSRMDMEQIKNVIVNGVGAMPAQKHLSEEDVNTLAAWLADKK